ncbi:hypothetical protein OIU77_008711 [Salix suchowensis]|uniref:Uncharacterized protein n=1 Tax=Salix suchowensis TaxID=1278906 RepID=A0ABQ9ABW5_9ROSI|nr:hypothetical protein OIU77_008711 [Salix suchowensis]
MILRRVFFIFTLLLFQIIN